MSSSPAESLFDKSPFFELRFTTHGGRSLFAIRDIEPGTRIHSTGGPFAHVIYKDYRKEVCAQCFAYSASDDAPPTVGACRTWSIKWSRPGATTAWFCSEVCRDSWERDETAALLKGVDALLTKGQTATRKRFKSPEEEVKVKAISLSCERSGDSTITQEAVNGTWERVEALVTCRAYLALCYSTLHLEDTELEIARSLAGAIVHRYCDDHFPSSDSTSKTRQNRSENWGQFVNLQTSELCNIRTRPYILDAYLRIYVFLLGALPKHLQKYTYTIREVLARGTGNAFGIWDGDRRDEMMGWGIWISASYFNHSALIII